MRCHQALPGPLTLLSGEEPHVTHVDAELIDANKQALLAPKRRLAQHETSPTLEGKCMKQ